MKSLSKTLLALYLLILLWLVLFKFSFNLSSVLDYQTRSLNLIPFAGASRDNLREMIYNFVVFIPFGLLLSVNLKRANFWRKLAFVFIFSLAAEMIQFVFAIGATDITDVITNTFGGFLGLILYDLSNKYVDNEKLDRFIVVAGTILLILFILLRFLFFKVRYQSAH
ncbi:VanZ family protein [Ktedonobacter racemifer]|uniref:VanZ family protein n=1 Tax=Ktedonobacter racemifer DSM 44963 TaxID=485913 RepID=D6TW54_KTERA|nr:VanZ family protein [Ktedonobacter racemifer]EFH84437.1 VanZ family protein [Ktedonobacter racemifer DSM 44963]